jgi:glycosyltransferase involved in cell wall biosynthesis
MILLFINTTPIWGGGEQWTYQSALEFKKRNYQVQVLTLAGTRLAARCKQADITCSDIPAGNRLLIKKKFIRRFIPDRSEPLIILCNSGRDLSWAAAIKRRHPRTNLIFRRGLDRHNPGSFLKWFRYRAVDMIIANSTATANTVRKSFPWFAADKIQVLYNPIDTAAFLNFPERNIRSELQIPAAARVIGIIGRLSRQKGHLHAFKIMQRLRTVYPEIYLLVVGSGEEEQSLHQSAKEFGIYSQCRFTGHVDTVQPYYRACDVILIPSLFEGFCFTAIEAQLLECPVVAFNTSSLPEVVQHEQGGFLAPAGDLDQMSRYLRLLLDDRELNGRMGKQGREYVERFFSAGKIYNQWENLFTSIQNNQLSSI